jgi:hypothetical protein
MIRLIQIRRYPRYLLDQNAAIAAGTLSGIPINLKVLGVGNGLTVCSIMIVFMTSIVLIVS